MKEKNLMTDIFKYSLGGLGITLVTNLVMTYFNFFLTDIFWYYNLCGCGHYAGF